MANYRASDIKTAVGLEHPRRHPGMYGFNTASQQGQFQLIKEIVDNANDEALMAPDRIHNIDITICRKPSTYQITIKDQGRGVPLQKVLEAFTIPGTSGKDSAAYVSSSGIYGMGVKVSAAMSDKFCVISTRKEGMAMITLKQSITVSHVITREKQMVSDEYGTIVMFEPDSTILSGIDQFFEQGNGYDKVLELLQFIAVFTPNAKYRVYSTSSFLTHADLKSDNIVEVKDRLVNSPKELIFETPFGISTQDYLKSVFNIESPDIWVGNPLVKHPSSDRLSYHVDMFISKDFARRGGCFISSVNMIKIVDKTSAHIIGLSDSIKSFMIPHIVDKDIISYFKDLYQLPINFVITVKYDGATFIGQDKNRFTDKEFQMIYRKHLEHQMKSFGPEYWAELFELLSDDIENKYHAQFDKELKINAGLKNLAFNLNNPHSYCGCRSKDSSITELFLTEGTSAGDFVKQVCDKNYQAVFKLRGKPINPFKCDIKRLRANEIYQDLVTVLGVSRTDPDLSKCNFNRIVLLTDADADGYHIASLLIGLLYSINKKLLDSGRVIIANPPLYVLQVKHDTLFARDMHAYRDAKVTMYNNTLSLSMTIRGRRSVPISGALFRDVVYLIWHVGKVFDDVANKLIIDPLTIEIMASVVDYLEPVNTDKIKEALDLDNCVYEQKGNSLLLNIRDVEFIVPLNNLVQEIRRYILPELQLCHWQDIEFDVTTTYTSDYVKRPVSIVQLYQIFNCLDRMFSVSRMKGLGEMSVDQLKYTCVDPITRSFSTITSLGDLDNIYESLGVNTHARKVLMSSMMKNGIES